MAAGLDTQWKGPSGHAMLLTLTHSLARSPTHTLSYSVIQSPSHPHSLSHAITHQVVTASLSSDTLIHRFTVLPTSFEPSFTHAVALQGSEISRVTSSTICCCCCILNTCCSCYCCCSPVQGRRRCRWRLGGSHLGPRSGSC